MKALSIKQPWASLIAHGIKDIEHRTWKTHFRGRIYIHASAKIEKVDFTQSQIKELESKGITICGAGYPSEWLIISAIIGEVDIVDCVINHPSIWAEKSDFQCCGCFPTNDCNPCSDFKRQKEKGIKPIYNWVLANPVLYDKPILNLKGKLSFWEPTPNQICMVCEKDFFGHDPQYCCNGNMCGCMGMPIDPVVCSEECYSNLPINKKS